MAIDPNKPVVPVDPTVPAMSSEDAANAAKYSTPLPPGDPASLRGSRQDPLYLGPTNFGAIQQKYTPYQIEQATTRNATGDVFWKEGVDINKISPSANGTGNLSTPSTTTTMPTSGASTTGVTMTNQGPDTAFGRAQFDASSKYLVGIQSTVDNLLAQQQKLQADAKAAAEAKVGALTDRLGTQLDSTQYQQSLQRDRDLFQVETSIRTLGTIQGKLADATSALESGLIYEENRPVRMSLLTGRMSELKKQGVAQINALSGAAEVVKGNIDLARAYADDSIQAIKADNAEKNAAMNTLLDLENAKLIQLTKDEKDTIKERRNMLNDESTRVEKNKDQVFDLATKYPSAFASGGVTFLDDPAAALRKMLPKMAADEKQRYDLEIAKAQADLAATGRSNRGNGNGSISDTGPNSPVAYIDWLKNVEVPDEKAAARGMSKGRKLTPEEIKTEVYKEFGNKKDRTYLDGIMTDIIPKIVADKPVSATATWADMVAQQKIDAVRSGTATYNLEGDVLEEKK